MSPLFCVLSKHVVHVATVALLTHMLMCLCYYDKTRGQIMIYIWVNSIALAHSAFLFIFVEMKECVLPACECC